MHPDTWATLPQDVRDGLGAVPRLDPMIPPGKVETTPQIGGHRGLTVLISAANFITNVRQALARRAAYEARVLARAAYRKRAAAARGPRRRYG